MRDMPANERMERRYLKLRGKRNIKFRAFLINWVLIAATWLIAMTPWYGGLVQHIIPGFGGAALEMYTLDLLGIWKILNVFFFLAPALAIWWEMCCMRHEMDN